jgi:hypothetical protein
LRRGSRRKIRRTIEYSDSAIGSEELEMVYHIPNQKDMANNVHLYYPNTTQKKQDLLIGFDTPLDST